MSISGPTLRMTREIIKAFADQLVAAAMGASSAIGFTPGPDFVERRVGAA
jgi:DNA-binding IclR family transcriptional regulator